MKQCTKCRQTKPVSDFYPVRGNKTGLSSWCKDCSRRIGLQYYEANRDRCNERSRKYHEKHKDEINVDARKYRAAFREQLKAKAREYRLAHPDKLRRDQLWAKYGVTNFELEEMFNEQGRKCAACRRRIEKWQVDHEHGKKGRESIRGILCHSCNSALGHAKDDLKRLLGLVRYLRKWQLSK